MSSPKLIKTIALGLSMSLAGIAMAPMATAAGAEPTFALKSNSNGKIRAGANAFQKGDFSKAAFFQKAALKSGLSKSRKAAAYTNLCAAEGALGNLEAAKTACASALELRPDAWQAANNSGVVEWLAGDHEAAAVTFASAVELAGEKGAIARTNAVMAGASQLASAN
ncbi:MAG: hypothetical protein COA47_09805 [Robiginitomaculum sp.]|nr:MAG: hypothetical protein COA47_09805 [Robiginitomaculum sp.]